MKQYAVHQVGQPRILRMVSCHPDQLQWQLEPGQAGIEVAGVVSDGTHYVAGGGVVAKPAPPTDDHAWDWEALAWAEPALHMLRDRQWTAIKACREAAESLPVAVDGIELDADAKSMQRIDSAVRAMERRGDASKNWRCADNVMRELTLQQLVAAGLAVDARRQVLVERSDALYQQLRAASTAAEIAAVVWVPTFQA